MSAYLEEKKSEKITTQRKNNKQREVSVFLSKISEEESTFTLPEFCEKHSLSDSERLTVRILLETVCDYQERKETGRRGRPSKEYYVSKTGYKAINILINGVIRE